MEVLAILIPVSIGLGIVGLLAFFWTMKNRQYEDPQGDAERILRHFEIRNRPINGDDLINSIIVNPTDSQ